MKTKVKLDSLKIQSFVTNLDMDKHKEIKGGVSGSGSCYGNSGGARTCGNTSCLIH